MSNFGMICILRCFSVHCITANSSIVFKLSLCYEETCVVQLLVLSPFFSKGDKFRYFLLAFLDNKILPTGSQLLDKRIPRKGANHFLSRFKYQRRKCM